MSNASDITSGGGQPASPSQPPNSNSRSQPAEGRIYDLGYQRYTGPREGRPRAVRALVRAGLRRAWGIGRPFRAKLAPWALFAIALVPALVALGIAALIGERFSPIRFENYYANIARILLLFCTAVAPELVCPDLRQRVLTLYFSRSVGRLDYLLARLGALFISLLIISLTPQIVLFVGNALAATDSARYVRDNLDALPRILAAGLLISLYFGSISLAVAAHTTRRVFAAGGFFALMLISTAVAASVHATLENDPSRALALLALSEVPIAATAWIFDAPPPAGIATRVDLPPGLWLLAALTYSALALLLLVRRYLRLAP